MKRISDALRKRIDDKDIELLLFVLFFISMSIYYARRIFIYAPWYDELYTYNYFVSNGPIYSAIHWPVPNNHIGYSVLSGIVYVITHNAFLSLRGISYIAALCNLCLIFILCRRIFSKGFSICAVALYSGMWLVNNLAVQGRGYTLATTMMLLCILSLERILFENDAKRGNYALWALAMAYGLYTLSSSLYWVIPVCACAGLSLLSVKKYRELIKIIIASIVSAVITFGLYMIVWLAIGSNLLIKEQADIYGAYSHVKLIVSHPVLSASRGIEYMLASPYIQSVSREGYTKAFFDHINTLFGQLYSKAFIVSAICIVSVLLAAFVLAGRAVYIKKNGRSEQTDDENSKKFILASWIVISFIVLVPMVVFIQCKLPYFRVFSFFGVFVAFGAAYILYLFFGRLNSRLVYCLPVILLILSFAQLSMSDYNTTYGDREQDIYELMTSVNLNSYANVAITDCDQEYMYKFVYDIENLNTDIENSDAVIIEKSMLDENTPFTWEFYYDYSSLPMDKLENMNVVYENEHYLLYVNGK